MLDVLPQFALVVRLPDVVDAPVDGALEDERAHDNAEGEGGGAFRDASVEGPRQRHGFAWGVLQAMRATAISSLWRGTLVELQIKHTNSEKVTRTYLNSSEFRICCYGCSKAQYPPTADKESLPAAGRVSQKFNFEVRKPLNGSAQNLIRKPQRKRKRC